MGRFVDLLQAALRARRRMMTRRLSDEDAAAALADASRFKQEIDRRRALRGEHPESFDDIQLTGRGARNLPEEWEIVRTQRRLVQSSNVYAYHFIPETKSMGILYVTFLHWEPGMKPEDRSGPGVTYAYYNFPARKYLQFELASASSAGKAVWDYCRMRGTVWGHQHPYMPVQTEGEYVPRKATRQGFVARAILPPNVSLEERKRLPGYLPNTLPGQGKYKYPGVKNSAEPDRGEPNRGTPNRGRK